MKFPAPDCGAWVGGDRRVESIARAEEASCSVRPRNRIRPFPRKCGRHLREPCCIPTPWKYTRYIVFGENGMRVGMTSGIDFTICEARSLRWYP